MVRPLGKFFASYSIATTGASLDGSQALIRALGEAVERYCGFNAQGWIPTRVIAAGDSPIAGSLPRCAPDEVCPEQLKRVPDDTLLTHGQAFRLVDGDESWIPLGYLDIEFYPKEPEPYMCLPISSGLSFHGDLARAIWGGLCEVAERDALMRFWWNRIQIPRIRLDGEDIPLALAERILRLKKCGITPYLFDMSDDFRVPTVFCLLVSDERPYFVVGNSCNENPLAACTAAIDEAVGIRSYQVREGPELPDYCFQFFDWIDSLDAHASLYGAWRNSPAFDFLLKGAEGREITFGEFTSLDWWDAPSSMDGLRDMGRRLQQLGLDVYYCDLTAEDVAALGCCVRVVVPQMVPISVLHSIRWLGCERLQIDPSKPKRSAHEFNPYPQPFA